MKKIKLSQEQLETLLVKEIVFLSKNETVEILDNELILNNNGKISSMSSFDIEFSEENPTDKFLQEIICNHFNFQPINVICHELSAEDSVFRLRLSPKKELAIVVCPIMTAIKNTDGFLSEKNVRKYCNKNKIGRYSRLGNSFYFFRWNEEFI